MPRPIKIGGKYYTDYREWCDGTQCKTPGKTEKHQHRRRRALGVNYQDSDSKYSEVIQLRNRDKYGGVVGDLSFELFVQKYLAYSHAKKDINTYTIDKLAFQYLKEAINIVKISQITPAILETVQIRWQDRGLSGNYINRLMNAVKAGMTKAQKWKIIHPVDFSDFKDIKVTLARIKFFVIEDLSRILKTFEGDYKTVAFLGGRAGLRIGEKVHLETSDIDFKLSRINVTAKPAWNPKDYEKRFVPMPPDLASHLHARIKALGRVLAHPWQEGSLSHMMARKLKEGGFDGTDHTLRHTYASHLVMNNVPIFTVSKLLGHASVQTTERHYAHLAPSHMDEAALKAPLLCS